MSVQRSFLGGFAALALIFAVGCASSTTPSASSAPPPQHAVILSGGNSGSTVVFIPSSDPQNPTMLSTSGGDVCPDCKAAAIKYFQTGVLDPKCARCGATRTAVNYQAAVAHN